MYQIELIWLGLNYQGNSDCCHTESANKYWVYNSDQTSNTDATDPKRLPNSPRSWTNAIVARAFTANDELRIVLAAGRDLSWTYDPVIDQWEPMSYNLQHDISQQIGPYYRPRQETAFIWPIYTTITHKVVSYSITNRKSGGTLS